ncbi:MAG: ATP-dependent Clp protease proteolytic subunit [Anaerolineae bacterium]|nr:ATP-dependent Clp protease proteolytic subunit [Anaerolineae bacterium]MCB9105568.1 ATP-dependent Clp protease proteolytic subunit [Anaerolineales bacterium]
MTSSLLIPTVIENTGRTERAYDIFSMLLNNRIIFLGAAIDDRLANLVVAQLLYLNQQDPEQEISLYIHSPGGNVYAGLAIYDTMQAISNPIATWAVGLTASMGTILLAAGTAGRRIALSHATIHMHPAGGGTQGYTTDVEIQYKELKRMHDLGHTILANHTGQSVETIAADFERDRWMDAETAKAYGLVDQVSAQSIKAVAEG